MAKKTATPVDNAPEVDEGLAQRIKNIEARWGKEFMAVMVDLHDHVWGTSPEAPAEVADKAAPSDEENGEKVG